MWCSFASVYLYRLRNVYYIVSYKRFKNLSACCFHFVQALCRCICTEPNEISILRFLQQCIEHIVYVLRIPHKMHKTIFGIYDRLHSNIRYFFFAPCIANADLLFSRGVAETAILLNQYYRCKYARIPEGKISPPLSHSLSLLCICPVANHWRDCGMFLYEIDIVCSTVYWNSIRSLQAHF